jgi:hypothetical protein
LADAISRVDATLPMTVEEFRTLNPSAVEYRYDDEMQSRLSRDELALMLSRVLEWANGKLASAQPAG